MSESYSQSIEGCSTIGELFWKRVTETGTKVALREKDLGIWNEYSWSQYGAQARLVGLGLKALGLKRGDVCSIAGEVCREWLFADLGIICVGGVTNGVYPTDSPNQVEYLINDSGTRFYFAEDEEQLDKVLEVRERTPTLEKVIIFDMEGLRNFSDDGCMCFSALLDLGRAYGEEHAGVWNQEIAAADPEDLMILTYTSGTTGPPKGAMISQRNMMYMMRNIQQIYGIYEDDEQVGFLPLAHVAGRMFYTFAGLESQCVVNLVEEPETAFQDQQEIAPTIHFAVPRVWEKQFSTIAIKLKEGTAPGRWAYATALALGARRAVYRKAAQRVPLGLELAYRVFELVALKNIRVLLGIDGCRWLSTAAAPIAPDLIDWYWALGRPMYEVYGQTECTGLATANLPGQTRIGSVGKATDESEVVLSEENEILIRGPGVIQGYWNKPEKSAETFRQGWLHTGDVGRVDEEGFIYVVDRMKDIIITAGGKNITPSEIENQLKFSPYITDAVVVGDRRPFLTCLVMIDHENVTKFAQDNDVPFTNYTSLCHTRAVQDLVWEEIEGVNAKFARVETIKKFRLIDQMLDPEDDELTPTQKLKRKVVNEKYADLIGEMY
ncbi:MAG: AMP-binding protein [Pseudomonadales bacterium]|jgi:long-chain acyl-CoA synthetase|nr:AMP-binding protein [Pseudomonadales bacterium]MDP6471165.1 AMP-binding protein [Pseudomonadales bacterium]MDP6825648.1 AMP-binding protein [Pseudomonadales bacterium]MDP6971617.1 AMP-binding protein [Pseudomonadales bacterium]|tara:strand:+ start:321 stop:2144 length:1824 start_codon:yes stop_codon:yes gene_type:complete